MKKLSKILLASILTLGGISLAACSDKEPTKTDLVYGQLFDTENRLDNFAKNSYGTTKTTYSALQTLIQNKENFVAVIRGSYPCNCWNTFRDKCLLPYIQYRNLKVYLIENSIFDKEGRDDFGINHSNTNHNVAIIKEGKVVEQKFAIEGEDFHTNFTVFKGWMDERISTQPKMLYVSKTQLDNLYKGIVNPSSTDKLLEFTIYFSRSTCIDCTYFDSHFLKPFLSRDGYVANSSCYIIDCDQVGVRYSLNEEDEAVVDDTQWKKFKADYGLSYSEENPAGYNTGYVPTLYHIQCNDEGNKIGDVIDGADVFFNDTYEKQLDGSYKITESYFTKERNSQVVLDYLGEEEIVLKGITYPSANSLSGADEYYYYQDIMYGYHADIAKKFLQHYIGSLLN